MMPLFRSRLCVARGLLAAWALLFVSLARAGESPVALHAYKGAAPTLDGTIGPGEYDDAAAFTSSSGQIKYTGWVKHDGESLYFAFDVTDPELRGIDTGMRWSNA